MTTSTGAKTFPTVIGANPACDPLKDGTVKLFPGNFD